MIVTFTINKEGQGEVRCTCHSLLARVVDGHLELKCRRCRHLLLVELAQLSGPGPAVELHLHQAEVR